MQPNPDYDDDCELFKFEGCEPQPLAISFTLRRTTVEYAHVKVFVKAKHMKDGRFDPDHLAADAVQLGLQPDIEWKPEQEPVVEMNPIQRPPDAAGNTGKPQRSSADVPSIKFGNRDTGTILDVTFASDRQIWCWKCVIAYTYDGFDIRTPSEKVNEVMLEGVRFEAERQFGEWPIRILTPRRTPGQIDYPPVRVTAFFTSMPMDAEQHLSSMVVVWFQSSQSPLVADEVREQLLMLEWESIAADYKT